MHHNRITTYFNCQHVGMANKCLLRLGHKLFQFNHTVMCKQNYVFYYYHCNTYILSNAIPCSDTFQLQDVLGLLGCGSRHGTLNSQCNDAESDTHFIAPSNDWGPLEKKHRGWGTCVSCDVPHAWRQSKKVSIKKNTGRCDFMGVFDSIAACVQVGNYWTPMKGECVLLLLTLV